MEATCEQRIDLELEDRLKDIRAFMDNPDGDEETGPFTEYGLGFDYVEPDTFDDQPEGYYRYQLSWGGPSDEFRFHDDGSIEYWFMDWFDGAHRNVSDLPEAQWLKDEFEQLGMMGP